MCNEKKCMCYLNLVKRRDGRYKCNKCGKLLTVITFIRHNK